MQPGSGSLAGNLVKDQAARESGILQVALFFLGSFLGDTWAIVYVFLSPIVLVKFQI